MTFSYTVTGTMSLGSVKAKYGTFTEDSTGTGGNIDTGLSKVLFFVPIPTGSSAAADQCTVDETFPGCGGTVTIVTTAGVDGIWLALGF